MTFEKWLTEWSGEIEQSQAFTKSELPTTPVEIQVDLSRTTRDYPRMAELLADVEQHLIQSRAQAVLSAKQAYGDLSAAERKIMADSMVSHIARTRDILKATVSALHERSYALMNHRNYCKEELRLSGQSET